MKLCCFMLFALTLFFSGCSDAEKTWTPSNSGSEIHGTLEQNNSIDNRVFNLINLDYPGLEKVKTYYEKGESYLAVQELLNYFRMRTQVSNPLISLMNVNVPSGALKMADDALTYRLYVKNYTDDTGQSYEFPRIDNVETEKKMIDWSYEPNADGEFRSQLFRFKWVEGQGKAYRALDDEKYVESFIEIYTDFLAQYPTPTLDEIPAGSQDGGPLGAFGPLPVAERMDQIIDGFFYFMHSMNFTPKFLSTYITNLVDQVSFIKNHYYAGGNNIYVSQLYTITKAALLFPEFKVSEEWLNEGASKLGKEVSAQFLDDGMQYELDLGYHIGVVATFYNTMIIANANHKSDALPANYVDLMRKSTDVLMNLTYPNYSVDCFNDTRPRSKNVITKNLKRYVEMFPENQEMKWLAYQGKQGQKPTHLTKAFPCSGYYVLRNGWDVESMMMVHSNNCNAHWHSQGDNGTFGLYRNGRQFLPDTGCYTYQNGSLREWYRSAKQHNTMTLNDEAIKDDNRNGKFLKLETINNTDILVTENQSYDNMKHRRAIFFVDKKFFVLIDEGIGTAQGKVSLNFHMCLGEDQEIVYDLDRNGAHTAFADKNNMIFRTFSGEAITAHSFTGQISEDIDKTVDRKSYEINYNKSADEVARFITVIMPNDAVEVNHDIAAKFVGSYTDNGAAVEVTVDGQVYSLNYSL